ncbi:hypothetical protein KGQ20_01255 [Catenulispora sp. NF23]|uniref:hypothetical protein n=1 Tax=Catenulispora pinistramenti TaxID=2705254 RepID=UPI001BA8552A|nr:hypothetical protein [Catenulispora pinistramenti]MBS2531388.1 hypothetical protein [Catenulispora pinistramenti]
MEGWNKVGWSFESARVPMTFSAARRPGEEDVEHAAGHLTTLCGIPTREVDVYRHLFASRSAIACASCREQSVKAPTQPCVQEKLYRILDRSEGPLRDELREALRAGTKVPFWANGPAGAMLKHYIKFDRIVQGSEDVIDLEGFDGLLGVARAVGRKRRFLVLIPAEREAIVAVEEPERRFGRLRCLTRPLAQK